MSKLSSDQLQGVSLGHDTREEATQLAVNRPLVVNSSLTITPSSRPLEAKAGSIYFDNATGQFVYYDGAAYQTILNGQSLNQLSDFSRAAPGTGLSLVGGVLNNTGVLSLQGQAGNVSFVSGPGISLDGLTISNSGVTAVSGTANQIAVSSANGSVSFSLPQDIGVGSSPAFAGLSLSNALSIGNGGTGATASNYSNNGVVYFDGVRLVSTATAASDGLCLLSTAFGPAFGSCAGGAAVSSVNGLSGTLTLAAGSGVTIIDDGNDTITISSAAASGVASLQGATSGGALTGALTISNASTSGSVVTLDDATTAAKGIASFSSSDFSVSSGAVSLNSVAVTKGGTGKNSFSTNTVILGDGANGVTELAAGSDGECLIIVGGAPVFSTCTGAGGVSSVNSKSGSVTVQGGTAIGVDNSGASIVLNNTGVTQLQGTADQVSVSGSTGSVTISLPQSIGLTSDVTFNQVTLGLNGSSAGKAIFRGSTSNSVTLQAPASPSNGLTFTLPAADGNLGDCIKTNASGVLSFGSCVGGGSGGGISGLGNANKIAKFTSGQEIGDSSLTDDGSTVTIDVDAVIQGSGGLLIGASNVSGVLVLSDGSSNTTTLLSASLGTSLTFTLPNSAGSNGQCIKTNGSGTLSFGDCLSGSSGSGVNSLVGGTSGDSASGNITINNATSTSSSITIDNATTSAKGIASFNSSHFSVSSGAVSIATDGVTLGVNTSGNYVASITAGNGLTGTSIGEGATPILAVGAGNGITVNADDITLNLQANKGLQVDGNGLSLIDCSTNEILKYNASNQWVCDSDTSGSGVDTVGAIDTQTKAANGAVISGTSLYLQTADASNPGLVSTGAQTLAGAKTFSSLITGSAGISTSGGAVTLQGNSASSLTTSSGALTITSASAATWSTTTGNLTLQGGSGTVSLGTSTALTANAGLSVTAASGTNTLTLDTGSSAGTVTLGATAGTVNLGAAGTKTLTLGSTTSSSTTTIQSGTGNLNLSPSGSSNTGVVVKPGTNSTAAFQIQNAGSTNLFNVDTTNGIITMGNSAYAELGSWQTNGQALPNNGRTNAGSVYANGYIYVLGGNNGSGATSTVYYAKVNNDGSTGAWQTNANALPANREYLTAATENGYIYAIGGSSQNTVYYAKLNNDGSTGSWQTAANSLPANRNLARAVSYRGYIYVGSGENEGGTPSDRVYYAKVNADGSVGSWSSSVTGLTSIDAAAVAVSDGFIYMIGGVNGTYFNSTQYAPINYDGSIGTWTDDTNHVLPVGIDYHTAAVMNGYLYVFGGWDGSNTRSAVYYTKLNANGTLNNWSTSTKSLTAARRQHTTVVANGYVYVLGGDNSGVQTTVYYNSPQRVKVNGSLDLVGSSNGNLNEVGGGGSLTAGNTGIVGTLQVQGDATFAQSISSNGNFNVAGSFLHKNSADTTTAFQVQNAAGTSLFTADTSGLVITVAGNTTTFATLTLTNAHFKSTQTNAPTIGTPSNCGTSPTAAVQTGSTDAAGAFRVTAGTGGPSTCDTVLTFNKAYGAAPKSVVITPQAKDGGTGTAAAREIYVSGSTTTTFTIKMNSAPADSEVNWFYYWVIE